MLRAKEKGSFLRVAVVSDIHGNLLALDAVMTDIEAEGVDQIWCAGDLAFGGPWASECIARVRDAGWPTVKGNTDVWITGDPQTVEDEAERIWLQEMAAGHNISPDDAAWLSGLPIGHSGPGSILMVHGTPNSPFFAPGPGASSAEFAEYEAVAALVIFGHVHHSFVRRLADGTTVMNPGSVGMPADGPNASYAIIEATGPEFTIINRKVPYDRRGASAQARVVGGVVGDFFLQKVTE